MRSAQNTMGIKGTSKTHSRLVAPLVIRAKKILVWLRALGIGYASHP